MHTTDPPRRRLSGNGSRSGEGWRLLAAIAFLTSLYLVTSPTNRFEAVDAYDYAAAIERGGPTDLISPFHLLYLPLAKAVHEPIKAVAGIESAFPALVALGALLAAATVVMFYRLLVVWLESPPQQSLFAAGGLAVSWGFWRYSAEVEVYAMAAFAAVGLLLFTVTRQRRTLWSLLGIAALASIAILAHILNVALVLTLPFLLRSRDWPWSKVTGVVGVAGALLVSVSLGAFLLSQSDTPPSERIGYIQYYLSDDHQDPTSFRTLAGGVAVAGSVVVAANSAFGHGAVRAALSEWYPTYSLAEQFYMGETSARWVAWAGLGSTVAVITLFLLLLPHLRLQRWYRSVEGRLLIGWLAGYLLIVIRGANLAQPEVWILGLVPLWALLACSMIGRSPRPRLLAAIVVALAANSLLSGFAPLYTSESRLEDLAAYLEQNGTPGDLVLTADSSLVARYLAYNAPVHTAHVGVGRPEIAAEVLKYIETSLKAGLDTPEMVAALRDFAVVYGYRPDEATGRLFITRELFDPPPWLENFRPESSEALRRMGIDLRQLFAPVEGAEHLLLRISDR